MMYYFPLSPRLQRLYASEATAAHMRWHDEHQQDDGTMCHPSDSEAWKHFNRTHPSFSYECRNVRLGLCTVVGINEVSFGSCHIGVQISLDII